MIIKKIHIFLLKIYVNVLRLSNVVLLYQPTYMTNKFRIIKNNNIRESDKRIDLIISSVGEMSGSYLDVGSQLGYFVFKMSEKGFFSMGIESERYAYSYSNSLKVINENENVVFMNKSIDNDNIKDIPSFDVVSIMNVFHHLVYFLGFDNADIVMRELYNKTNKILFFETGEYEEKGEYWSDCLSFMGEDSSVWIHSYLLKIGFSDVKKIGESSTHLNPHKRTLYLCCK